MKIIIPHILFNLFKNLKFDLLFFKLYLIDKYKFESVLKL
jgi:hypothetical protein